MQIVDAPPKITKPRLADPAAMEAAFSFEDGFHRADWDFVRRWIDSHVSPADSERAWNEVARKSTYGE